MLLSYSEIWRKEDSTILSLNWRKKDYQVIILYQEKIYSNEFKWTFSESKLKETFSKCAFQISGKNLLQTEKKHLEVGFNRWKWKSLERILWK